jgi:hypothetical protein
VSPRTARSASCLHDPCKTCQVGSQPGSRREALLYELSDYSTTALTADDLTGDLSARDIGEMILQREGLDPVMMNQGERERVMRMVTDWLFDPCGRGARSGLPR